MKKSKLLSVLCLLMVLSLTACGSKPVEKPSVKKSSKPKTEASVDKPSSSNTGNASNAGSETNAGSATNAGATAESNQTATETPTLAETDPEKIFPFWRDDVVSVTTKIDKDYYKHCTYYNKYGHVVAKTNCNKSGILYDKALYEYEYDENGQLLHLKFIRYGKDNDVLSWAEVDYDPSASVCEKDPRECFYQGHIEAFVFPVGICDDAPKEKVVKVVSKEGDYSEQTYEFKYDSYGHNVINLITGNIDEFIYDDLGRVVRANTYIDSSSSYAEMEYDADKAYQYNVYSGKREYTTINTYENGRLVEVLFGGYEEPLEITDSFVYDGQGRLVKAVNDYEEVTEYKYDDKGNVIQKDSYREESVYRSPYSYTHTYEYDDRNRVILEQYVDNEDPETKYKQGKYKYEYYEVEK